MFQIGEVIIYPMHGAGIIEAIEEKEFLGKVRQYYIIKMSISKTQILIPTDKILTSSIRRVTDILELKNILHIFQYGESEQLLPWKKRYKVNTDKVNTGNIQACVEVVRDLMRMKQEKALNASEKAMLTHAHKFLINELHLIKGITENEIQSFS